MKILITGGKGMLGQTLQRVLSEHALAIADLPEVDITNETSIAEAVRAFQPTHVVHCAAMTQVDLCETEQERAFRINARGSEYVAKAAQACSAHLIAISTDYVFDGTLTRPYRETDRPNPKTVYGASKFAGEQAIQQHAQAYTIVRTAWLYGEKGPSFVHTMIKLGEQADQAPLRVVDDQIGNPTSTDALAAVIVRLLKNPIRGIVHGTCEGEATWYEFAQEVFRLKNFQRQLLPCTTAEYPRPAPRPANSRLEKSALRTAGFPAMPDWRQALATFLNG